MNDAAASAVVGGADDVRAIFEKDAVAKLSEVVIIVGHCNS